MLIFKGGMNWEYMPPVYIFQRWFGSPLSNHLPLMSNYGSCKFTCLQRGITLAVYAKGTLAKELWIHILDGLMLVGFRQKSAFIFVIYTLCLTGTHFFFKKKDISIFHPQRKHSIIPSGFFFSAKVNPGGCLASWVDPCFERSLIFSPKLEMFLPATLRPTHYQRNP